MSNEEKDDATFPPGARPQRPKGDALGTELRKERVRERLFGKKLLVTIIGKRFTLIRHIRSGGMGSVYSAYDQRLDRIVAIKLLREELNSSQEAQKRLIREARTQGRLHHPNVVQIHDADVHEGAVYIAMEYLGGGTLEERLKNSEWRARWRDVLDFFIAAGRGLEAAHKGGITHRDFKPSNVLISKDGRPQVSDFGLARVVDPAQPNTQREDAADPSIYRPTLTVENFQTEHGKVMGTPTYMSPEQMQGKAADSRSDQFSFCVALYEAFYDQHPFPAFLLPEFVLPATEQDIKRAIAQSNLTPPRNSKIPAGVRKAILRGLSYNADERFSSMGELLHALSVGASKRYRWLLASAAAGAVLTAILLVSSTSEDPCAKAGQAMDAVWSKDRKAAIQAAFAATGLPQALTVWNSVSAQIDAYAQLWQSESRDACKASHTLGPQMKKTVESRLACLDGELVRLDARLDGFQQPSPLVVAHAREDIATLPDPRYCEHGEFVPPPAGKAEQLKEARGQLEEALMLARRGEYKKAVAIAERQEELAKSPELNYKPLLAEAQFVKGWVLVHYGTRGEIEGGEKMLKEAASTAASARLDPFFVTIVRHLVLSVHRNQYDQQIGIERWERLRDALARISDLRQEQAELHRLRALLEYRVQNFEAAETELKNAINMVRQDMESKEDKELASFRHAVYLHDLANVQRWRHQNKDARSNYEQAIKELEPKVGEVHPDVSAVRFDLALLEAQEKKYAKARDLMKLALTDDERYFGTEHERIAGIYAALAGIERDAGNKQAALEYANKAIEVYEKRGRRYSEHGIRIAIAYSQRGAIRYAVGQLREAVADYEQALALLLGGEIAPETRLDAAMCSTTGPGAPGSEEWPRIIEFLSNLAEAHLTLKAYDEAGVALDCAEMFKPPDKLSADYQAYLDSLRGQVHLGTGNAEQAVEVLRRSVNAFQPFRDTYRNEVADGYFALARALAESGGSMKEAIMWAEQAKTLYPEEDTNEHDTVRQWLRQHKGSAISIP